MRAVGNAIELTPMRFGFPPPRPKASPIFNFRSEGQRFDKSQRCLIPASAFFEFTGKKYPKAMHRFSVPMRRSRQSPASGVRGRIGSPRSRC
jgi:putative SOS response-associated peptidase YedK